MSADLLPGNVGAPQSLNRYAYAMNDPVNLVDPLGLRGISAMIFVCTDTLQFWDHDVEGNEVIRERCVNGQWVTFSDWGDDGSDPGGGGGGGGGDQGKAFRERMAKQFLQDLTECIKSLYKIDLKTFQEAHHGMNGLFEGADAKGNKITVVNDVGSYTKLAIRMIAKSFTAIGMTPPNTAREQTNYTASDLDIPELYTQSQIHELAHSLDQITSGSIFGSSEKSADRLDDCIKSKQASRGRRH